VLLHDLRLVGLEFLLKRLDVLRQVILFELDLVVLYVEVVVVCV
jgi:hypothetical protein